MSLLRHLFVLGATAASLAMSAPSHAQAGPVVDAPAGVAEGTAQGELRVFKGLPYAQPPVGPARWTPPEPTPRWAGVRDATRFGPACSSPFHGPSASITTRSRP